jgi:hypothetical protein
MKEKPVTFYLPISSSACILERRSMKRFHIALGVADVESPADGYSQASAADWT